MITTTQQMGYQIHNTHHNYKKDKLGEPKANHVIHGTPYAIWIESLTKFTKTWLMSAGHKGEVSLNKGSDL